LNQPTVSKPAKRWLPALLKRGLTVIAFAVLVYLFWPFIGEMRNIFDLLRTASWGWLGLAVVIEVLSYTSLTGLNFLLLQPFQGKISFWRMLAILPSIAFIEVALPSAGASGVVLRARLLGRHGYSVESSTFTNILETIYLSVFMVAISLSGLWYLIRRGELNTGQLAILAAMTVAVLVAGLWIYWTGRKREGGKTMASWFLARWNRLMALLHRPPYRQEELDARLGSFYEGLSQLGQTRHWPFLMTAGGRVFLDVVSLGACFAVFHYSIPLGVLLTGYGLTLLLSGLAALPGGLGLADLSLAVIYARLGAPGAVAVAAALSYRLIAFWLVRFIGFVTWQVLEVQS
jgi:uncharacterized protein (TIRG00374 family)